MTKTSRSKPGTAYSQRVRAKCTEAKLAESTAALNKYVERDHAEALIIEIETERCYRMHGPWCRCDECTRLWPTAYKLPVRAKASQPEQEAQAQPDKPEPK